MTDDFQQISGVGEAREEDLNEAGYETFDDLAGAESEELKEEIPRLSEDKALELIVQAQNMAEAEEAEVEENPEPEPEDETVEVSESMGGDSTEDDDSTEDEGEKEYTVALTIESAQEYDALYDCLLTYRQKLIATNRPGIERVTGYIGELRDSVVGDELLFEMTETEINDFHNALLQHRIDYQGRNLREQFTAAKALETRFNDERERHLF